VNELWRILRDPRVTTSLVLAAAVVVGFGLLILGHRGAAALLLVAFQVPYLVSGAVVGLAFIGTGLALLIVHLDRTEAAEERRAVAGLQRDVLRLLAVAPQARERRTAPQARERRTAPQARGRRTAPQVRERTRR